jgi:DNA mismatch repair protein MutL
MGRIVVLDAVTAGRIAAGEVVERPASVAKELVENALDAKATRIEVDLEDGGRLLLRVSDNGEGLSPEDVSLAFERHATSKLARAEDLETVASYGFRGEALPSIGAVARVRLLTCPKGATEGREVIFEGGRLVSASPGAAREGTIVWVRDLFFNTPARREAMRSAAAETARVSEVVGTLALAAPGVAMSLTSGGQLLWSTPGTGCLREALAGVQGATFAREMTPVDWRGPINVSGLAGLPSVARRDGKRQYLFCNGRPINPRILHDATDGAYKTLLATGQTPAFVLALFLPPATVDVNVNPAKTYVRFRNHGEVHRAVLAALRTALERADLFAGRLEGHLAPAGRAETTAVGDTLPIEWRDIFSSGGWAGRRPESWEYAGEERASFPAGSGPDLPPRGGFPALLPLGQVGGVFIIAAAPDGIYILDQHAAHERVVYEGLIGQAAGTRLTGEAQVLAVPVSLELGPGEEEVLERSLLFLRQAGFDIEPFGPRAAIIRAVPAVLAGVSPVDLISDFLDRLAVAERPSGLAGEGDKPEIGFDREVAARTLAACRAAVKQGERLSLAEMDALLKNLAGAAEPRTCPHGRPTLLRIGLEDLRRGFERA